MDVRNLSGGSVYLIGTPQDYPELFPGYEFELTVFGTEDGLVDEDEFNIVCRARVVRIDPGNPGRRPAGFGVVIEPVDDENRESLRHLLARATHYRPGASPIPAPPKSNVGQG